MRKHDELCGTGRLRETMAVAVMVGAVLAGYASALGADAGIPPAAGAPQPSQAAAPPGGPQESIKVHGHWTIEVRNPDGTLVSRREFENALTNANRVPRIFARTRSVGLWMIDIAPACVIPQGVTNCTIMESSATFTGSNVFKTLTVAAPDTGANAGKLVLSGTATAQADSVITSVSTSLVYCANTVAPSSPCQTGPDAGSIQFTQATVNQQVLKDQIVQVTVVISFS